MRRAALCVSTLLCADLRPRAAQFILEKCASRACGVRTTACSDARTARRAKLLDQDGHELRSDTDE